jgi:hypothetical protein
MADYIWYQHESEAVYTTVYDQGNWVYQGEISGTVFHGYSSYNFDSSTGTYSDPGVAYSESRAPSGPTLYSSGGSSVTRSTWINSNTYGYSIRSSQATSVFSHYTLGRPLNTFTAPYDAYVDGQRSSDGYFYLRGPEVNFAPDEPQLLFPMGGEILSQSAKIQWLNGTDPDHDPLYTAIQFSRDGVSFNTITTVPSTPGEYQSIEVTFPNVSSQAVIRIAHYDGTKYSNYIYSESFRVSSRSKVDELSITTPSGTIKVPIFNYQQTENPLYIQTASGICEIEIGEVDNPRATPLRIMTRDGVKAIIQGY